MSTRPAPCGGGGGYRHELDDAGHLALLQALRTLRGMVVLCGYPCDLYDQQLPGWTRHETDARISGGRGTAIRTEVVWLNPACEAALAFQQGSLFSSLTAAAQADQPAA